MVARVALRDALMNYVEASTWEDSFRCLQIYQKQLLTSVAVQLLSQLITQFNGDRTTQNLLTQRLFVLQSAINKGIEPAFEEFRQYDELISIIRKIQSIPFEGNAENRIEQCQTALKLCNKGVNLKLWLQLKGEVANSIVSAISERPELYSILGAIQLYEEILQEEIQDSHVDVWITTQRNLAVVYGTIGRGSHKEDLAKAIFHIMLALSRAPKNDMQTAELHLYYAMFRLKELPPAQLIKDAIENIDSSIQAIRKSINNGGYLNEGHY
jgi:hypothetical protein